MRNRMIGALAVGVASAALLVAGAGAANAADPTCLQDSISGAAADPAGALGAVLSDPAGSAQADLDCAQEVLGG